MEAVCVMLDVKPTLVADPNYAGKCCTEGYVLEPR